MDDRTAYPSSLLSFLLGGLAGAGIALLFAPQSGRATRHAVSRSVRHSVDTARGLGDRVVRRGKELKDEAGKTLADAVDSVERRASELRRRDTTL